MIISKFLREKVTLWRRRSSRCKTLPLSYRQCDRARLEREKPRIIQLDQSQTLGFNVAFRSESIASLLEITATSDVLFPTSMYLLQNHHPRLSKLTLAESIVETLVSESQEIELYMHYRNRSNPMFKWLLSIINELFEYDFPQDWADLSVQSSPHKYPPALHSRLIIVTTAATTNKWNINHIINFIIFRVINDGYHT